MLELTFLILLDRMANWGLSPVFATRTIPAGAPALRALLADPAGQWRLVDGIDPRLRPRAHVEPARTERLVSVRVSLRGRDAAWLTWILSPGPGTTEVDLAAQIESRAVLVRLAMKLGGRRWLRRRLERTLGTLAVLAHRAAEDLDDVERHAEIAPGPQAPGTPTTPRA